MHVGVRQTRFPLLRYKGLVWKNPVFPHLYLVFLLLSVCFSCSTLTGPEISQDTSENPLLAEFWVVGYHPYWMNDSWKSYDYSALDQILFFDVSLDSDGTIKERNGWPDRWNDLRNEAGKKEISIVPTVSILDSDTFLRLFENPDHVITLRETLVSLVQETAPKGLHLDFEMYDPVTSYVRRAFTRFVRNLRSDLTAIRPDVMLTMFSLGFDENNVYDELVLSEYVDYFVVQGYDLHWINDSYAGPIAPLRGWDWKNWNSIVQRYGSLGIPKKKLVMGVPYYGYEWPTEDEHIGSKTRGPGIITTFAPLPLPDAPVSALERVNKYGSRRDAESGSPYYVFNDSTGWYQGWYEDAESLSEKYEFVKQQRLGGIAIFPLGYGDETLAAALQEAFRGGPSWLPDFERVAKLSDYQDNKAPEGDR